MELHPHSFQEIKYPDEKSLSKIINYIDYTFVVEFDNTCENQHVVKYLWQGNVSGSLIFESQFIGIKKNEIEEKSFLLIDAAAEKLLGHIILDLKLSKDELDLMSSALQIHATRKLKENLKYF